MITFTPGQELQFDGDQPRFAKRYYIGQYIGKIHHIWYLRVTSRGVRTIHDGSAVSFTAGTSRLPLLLTMYYARRI